MRFYDQPKEKRTKLVQGLHEDIFSALQDNQHEKIDCHFSDGDTYIRKAAYVAIGKIYTAHKSLQMPIINVLSSRLQMPDFKIRQTAVNAAGEIGMNVFEVVEPIFDLGLFDHHHAVRNAVIGSIKKMGQKNPVLVLKWARKYLHHPDKEIRREICHGIELRGRTHPADILPLLKELEHDATARVRKTLIHVIGQISYKKNCLAIVMSHLESWKNKELVLQAVEEIIDVHHRYKDFAAMTQEEAADFIKSRLK